MALKKGTLSLKKQKTGRTSKPKTTKNIEDDVDTQIAELEEEQGETPLEHTQDIEVNEDGSSDEDGDNEGEEIDNDEMDVSDISSLDDNTDDEIEGMKAERNKTKASKLRQSKEENTESFSNAMDALLNSHLKAHDRSDPILVRQKKKIIKKLNDEKLDAKAKRLLKMERKELMEKGRQKDLLPQSEVNARLILEHEKKLKKTAQRGVIKLFNAILNTQIQTDQLIDGIEEKRDYKNDKKNVASEISKETFLDMVKAAK